jgi:hypothetical protein
MPQASLGPIEVRYFSGLNWSNFELAWVTARKQGFAQRETALRCSFKSEHLLDIAGTSNPDDTLTVDGTTYHGRCSTGIDGAVHTLTARQVAARAVRIQAMQQGLQQANRAAVTITGDSHLCQATTDQPAEADLCCSATTSCPW